ncbi:MAG: hypothetical protein AAB631_02180 [Patescibacteria group bacterium]
MDEHKKFGAGEIIIGTFFALGVDGISILIDITGVGVIIAPVIQGFATFAITMWFRSKGDPNATKLGKQILKYGLNLLPVTPIIITAFTITIPFLIEVFIHNNPKLAAITEKVAAKGGPAAKIATKTVV